MLALECDTWWQQFPKFGCDYGAAFFRRIFGGGGKNFSRSRYSALARKPTTVISTSSAGCLSWQHLIRCKQQLSLSLGKSQQCIMCIRVTFLLAKNCFCLWCCFVKKLDSLVVRGSDSKWSWVWGFHSRRFHYQAQSWKILPSWRDKTSI